jgi:Xaa-Pro aminopeptidase
VRSPELRHEVPADIVDPFLWAERGGRAYAVVFHLDADIVRAARPDAELLGPERFGLDELLAEGRTHAEADVEIARRVCAHLGLTAAVVPPAFPLEMADGLRAAGIDLAVDRPLFEGRRRVKSAAELEGIRRALRAAEAGVRAVADRLAAYEEGLTVEDVRPDVEAAFAAHGAAADTFIVAPGPQSALGHEEGHGPIAPGVPVVVDVWPQDRASSCFADMTRTFVAGEPDPELVAWHALCREALERCVAAMRPGAAARDVWGVACDVFEEAGHPTQRTKAHGEVLRDGFSHGLGHGVGLEVHEAPMLGRSPDVLVAGDVIAVEPGTYRQGYGGVRLEDLVLVTDDGAEVLTDFPYELAPG